MLLSKATICEYGMEENIRQCIEISRLSLKNNATLVVSSMEKHFSLSHKGVNGAHKRFIALYKCDWFPGKVLIDFQKLFLRQNMNKDIFMAVLIDFLSQPSCSIVVQCY